MSDLATVIVATPQGQLGNRLFQAAHFFAASREMGFELWNPALGQYARWFPAVAGDLFCRPWRKSHQGLDRKILCRIFEFLGNPMLSRFLGVAGCGILDIRKTHDGEELEYDLCGEEFHDLLRRYRFLIVRGWKFRAHEAMKAHSKKILDVFQPDTRICEEVALSVGKAKSDVELLIGVHVRRGDYEGWLGGKYFFGLEDYARWMREAVLLWPEKSVSFLLCSNEPIGSILAERDLNVFPGPGSAVADLYALACCDYIMGPPSTFTLWASFHGGAPLHMLESREARLVLESFTHHGRS